MRQHTFNINTIRLALSGALIGVAITGIINQHLLAHDIFDIIGGVVGFAATLVAKAKHIF